MKKLRIAAWIGFALVAGAIFYLTTQTPEATISASHWATEHLPRFLIAEMARRQRAADRQTNGAYLSVLRAGALRFPGHAGLCAVLPDGTGLGGDGHLPGLFAGGSDAQAVYSRAGVRRPGFGVRRRGVCRRRVSRLFYPVDHSEKAAEIVRKDRFRRIQKSVKNPGVRWTPGFCVGTRVRLSSQPEPKSRCGRPVWCRPHRNRPQCPARCRTRSPKWAAIRWQYASASPV